MKENQLLQQYSYDPAAAKALGAQFGFESELLSLEEALKCYQPTFPISFNWQEISAAKKSELLEAHLKTLRFGEKAKVLENPLLPDLHKDDTGNLEWILGPTENFFDLLNEVSKINEKVGNGSYQAMVSFPFDIFFSSNDSVNRTLGWLNFFQELDILERAYLGKKRWQSTKQAPLKTFLHPYLGPMIALRHKYLRKYLRENSQSRFFDSENMAMARSRDHSFKYVGSTAYRPDIAGPHRISLEVRDAHRDLELLKNRVSRILFYWSKNMDLFSAFSTMEPFDSELAFSLFDLETQDWLKSVASKKIPEQVLNFPKPKFTHEVFRNFAYPLRNWHEWIGALGGDFQRVKNSQGNYILQIRDLKKQCLSKSESLINLQVLLCDFVIDSGIFAMFRDREEKIVEELK
jgi:hypothetical protein